MYLYRVILQYYLRYNQRAIDVRFTLHKSQVAHQTGYKTFFFFLIIILIYNKTQCYKRYLQCKSHYAILYLRYLQYGLLMLAIQY